MERRFPGMGWREVKIADSLWKKRKEKNNNTNWNKLNTTRLILSGIRTRIVVTNRPPINPVPSPLSTESGNLGLPISSRPSSRQSQKAAHFVSLIDFLPILFILNHFLGLCHNFPNPGDSLTLKLANPQTQEIGTKLETLWGFSARFKSFKK